MEDKFLQIETLRQIEDESRRVSAIYEFFCEENRLQSRATQLEFLTTIRYLEAVLKPGMRILDLGAGTGVYSRYLAEKGHHVTAVELAERNVAIFREQTDPALPIRLIHGSALDLPELPDADYDLVLLFGPLYHLQKREDRRRCLQESRRLMKKEAHLFAALINHDMIPYTETNYDPDWFSSDEYDHESFRLEDFPFVFLTLDESRAMLRENGFVIEKTIAADGLSEILAEKIKEMSNESYAQYLRYHWLSCEKPEFLGATNHLLFQCRKDG